MPIPIEVINGKKHFTVLENNPSVFTPLAHTLGLSKSLKFIDIYSLDPDYLANIPHPVLALLVIIPLTPSWNTDRETEDAPKAEYDGVGLSEDVLWFQQTIGHACGSIGLLHACLNGPANEYITPNSTLAKLKEAAVPLRMAERAQLLYDSKELEEAHQSVANLGDTVPPSALEGDRLGQHFVTFIVDGERRLWELEGGRKGPLMRGVLGEGEDVVSEEAIRAGIGRVIELEERAGGGDLRFSVLALVKDEDGGGI